MNKTIYIRDEDVSVWERAKELAGDKLAPVIMEGLKRFVETKEAELKHFKRIELRYNDMDAHNLPKAKAFWGRWLLPPEKPWSQTVSRGGDGKWDVCCAVALTAKGGAAVYCFDHPVGDLKHKSHEHFLVFDSLDKAASQQNLNKAIKLAVETWGVPVEELDI